MNWTGSLELRAEARAGVMNDGAPRLTKATGRYRRPPADVKATLSIGTGSADSQPTRRAEIQLFGNRRAPDNAENVSVPPTGAAQSVDVVHLGADER
jgi:hypothetical protein